MQIFHPAIRIFNRYAKMGNLLTAQTLPPLSIQAIWLTPLFKLPVFREQLHKIAHPSFFVIGSADPHYQSELIKEIQEVTSGEVLVTEGADHGLLIQNNVPASLRGMERIIRDIQTFLEQ